MKSLLVLLAVMFMVAPAAMAQTFQFPDTATTFIVPYAAGLPIGGPPVDSLGGDTFFTSQINVILSGQDVTFQIFTNLPLAGTTVSEPPPSGTFIPMSDLAIDLDNDGVYERGVVLTTHGAFGQGLWNGVSWNTSNDLFASSEIVYGGKTLTPNDFIDVQIKAGTFVSALASISTTPVDNSVPGETTHTRIDVNLGNVNTSGAWNHFSFLYATGTCANDVLPGTVNAVPEPAALLLLGFGVIGVAGLRKKFTK